MFLTNHPHLRIDMIVDGSLLDRLSEGFWELANSESLSVHATSSSLP
jgi:hypothetical protein